MIGRQDSFISGLLMSLAAIIVGYGLAKILNWIFVLIFPDVAPGISDRLMWIIAVLFNMVPMNVFNRRGQYNSMRGVAIGTLLGVVAVIFFFFRNLFDF